MEALTSDNPNNANSKIRQESKCLKKINDDVFSISMYSFDDAVGFKVEMLDSLNTWEITRPLEFFLKSKAFSFAESISEVYEAFLLKFKPDEFEIKKEGNDLNLSFDFVLMNKKINFNFDLKYKNPEISIDILNQLMTEIKNLRNEVKDLHTKQNILIKKNELMGGEAIKFFDFENKTVFGYKVDAQKDIKNFKNFNLLYEMDWYSPGSPHEANTIIDYFHNNYSQHGLHQYTWMITYGVKTDPNNKKVGDYVINCNGGGHDKGDDGVLGKCNGTGFTAFRKVSCSFANPQTFGKLCNWDSSYHSIILLQSPKK
jgi:hypothetical protein